MTYKVMFNIFALACTEVIHDDPKALQIYFSLSQAKKNFEMFLGKSI